MALEPPIPVPISRPAPVLQLSNPTPPAEGNTPQDSYEMVRLPEDATDAAPATEHDELKQEFKERLPGVREPKDVLKIAARWGVGDSLDLTLCLRLAYPGVWGARDTVLSHLQQLCEYLSFTHVHPGDHFWRQDWWFLDRLKRYKTAPPQGSLVGVDYDDWVSRTGKMAEVTELLIAACRGFHESIGQVEERLELIAHADEDIKTLLYSLMTLEDTLKASLANARIAHDAQQQRQQHTMGTSSASSALNATGAVHGTDAQRLLEPIPGIYKTGSASSGNDMQHPAAAKNRKVKQSGLPQYRDGSASPPRRRSMGAGIKLVGGSVSDFIANVWNHARDKGIMRILGAQGTVWSLVLILAFVGSVCTAIAVWKAGPQLPIPELDSNFYSTVSQNSIGAGGLYCIIIPILRGTDFDVKQVALFRFWLSVSAIGACLSTITYPFQVRTSMVLACLSSLAQLLATLQLIEDAGSAVTGLVEKTVHLADEGEELRFEGRQLRRQVSGLERKLASLPAEHSLS